MSEQHVFVVAWLFPSLFPPSGNIFSLQAKFNIKFKFADIAGGISTTLFLGTKCTLSSEIPKILLLFMEKSQDQEK